MHRDKQQAIISQLREIYDGYYRKEFGTGETKDWEGKIGFIAGVTPIIDRHHGIYAVLGERFIQYRPEQPDPIALARKAMENSGGEKIMREEIQNAFADFLSGVKIPDELPTIPENVKDKIANLATLCAKGRSGVLRDGHSREIDLIPEPELPTRLAKVLNMYYIAFRIMGDSIQEEDYELIYKIGFDCLPQNRKKTLQTLILVDCEIETADVAMKIGYPTTSTRRILEDLHVLGLVQRMHEGQGYADRWQISENAKELLEKAKPVSLRIENMPESVGNSVTLPEKADDFDKEIESFFKKDEDGTLPEKSSENMSNK